jgi:hypothetical protein
LITYTLTDDKENEHPAMNQQELRAEEHDATADHKAATIEDPDTVYNDEIGDTAPRRVLRSAGAHARLLE